MPQRKGKTTTLDYLLLVTILALMVYGLLMLYSATFYVGVQFWQQQLIWMAVGLVAMVLLIRIPYPLWQKLAIPMMGVTLVLLLLVLLFGEQVLGANRALLGASIQPGVLARLVAVIYIAAWLASRGELLNQAGYGLFPFAIIVGGTAALVALQPDFSTALLLIVTGLAMFFFAGGDPVQLFLSVVTGGLTFGVVAWQFSHARLRLMAYLQSLQDPSQMSYHVRRAVTAIAEGGLFGVGLGSGRLKFGYLPFPHTDSVFAVIGEEAGLLGVLLVIGLFIALAYRGYRIALETLDPFGSLLAFGVTTMIISEAILNVMVMVGLIPFTGTALPFFSYGGSEMLMALSGMGLLLAISRGRPKGDWDAVLDRWGRNWRTYLSRLGRRAGAAGR